MRPVAVIAGAGPAGLTAALELLRRSDYLPLVFERDSQVGGISKTVNYRGNRMDLGGHRFFSKSDWVMRWWQDILPVAETAEPARITYHNQSREFVAARQAGSSDEKVMLLRPRLSRIYYRRRFFDYPLKLSPATFSNLGWGEAARLGSSYARARIFPRKPELTLEDFFVNRFGDRLYRTFFKDYTEKVWGVPCAEISAEWGAQRVKGLSILSALTHAARSALGRGASRGQVETSLIEQFLYPRLGPGQMWEEVARLVRERGGQVILEHSVVAMEMDGSRVRRVCVRDRASRETRWVACDALFSTMPVSQLVEQLQPADAEIARTASLLPYRDFMTAGLIVKRMTCTTPRDNWIYIQEPDVRLGRLQIFNNWCADLVADPATVSLGLEYFCCVGDDLWSMPDAAFLEFAASELEMIGLIQRADVIDGTVVRVPKAYPAYFGEYRNMSRVRDYLATVENLFPIGRNGMHRYNNQDHSMLAARAAVDCLLAGSVDKSAIWAVNTEEDYHESSNESRGSGRLAG